MNVEAQRGIDVSVAPGESVPEPAKLGRCSFLAAIAVPWRISGRGDAVRAFAGASVFAVLASLACVTLVTSVIALFIVATIERGQVRVNPDRTVEHFTVSYREVIASWIDNPVENPMIWIPVTLQFIVPFIAAVVATLYLPNAYRTGPIFQAWWRAFASVVACMGLVNVAFAAVSFIPWVMMQGSADWQIRVFFQHLAGIATIATVLGLLNWIARTVEWTSASPPFSPAPRCEGCGYDLTHLPEGGSCTECGMSIALSLSPGGLRPGLPWQRARDAAGLLSTIGAIVFSYRRHYAQAQVRRPVQDAKLFAVAVFAIICVATWMWIMSMALTTNNFDVLYLTLPVFFATLATAAGYAVHRVVGAIAFYFAIWRRQLDGMWVRTVMLYESAYLAYFCVFNGALITSMILFDGPWISELIQGTGQSGFVFGVPFELLLFFSGNLFLILLWFRRYVIAIRAIQWNNF